MSEMLAQIKAAQLKARKAKDTVTATPLTTVMGEVENLSKTEGGLADDIVMRVLRKNIQGVKDTIAVKGETVELKNELDLLESFYPKMLTEDEIRQIKKDIGATDVKTLMPYLSKNYKGLFDGKLAKSIAEED